MLLALSMGILGLNLSASCAAAPSAQPTTPEDLAQLPRTSQDSQVQVPPSGTDIPPKHTPYPSPTATITQTPLQVFHFKERCAILGSALPPDATGSLALDTNEGLLLIDMQSGKRIATLMGADRYVFWSYFPLVSPGARYLAFKEGPPGPGDAVRWLHVVDSAGREVTPPTWQPEWDVVTGWTDETTIEIVAESSIDGTMVAFNPFDTSTKILTPPFDDFAQFPDPEWYSRAPIVLYDPSLTIAAYVAVETHGLFYRLWDVPRHSELWRSLFLADSTDPPSWSPDGSKIAFSVLPSGDPPFTGQLTVVGRDGIVSVSVDLSSAKDTAQPSVAASMPSWSPQGDRIAFWIMRWGTDVDTPVTLAIIDLATREVTDYCVEGGYNTLIVWSPDGQHVTNGHRVLSLADSTVYELGEYGPPLGWLAPSE
jgi:hypothetical protein